jgi:hypothetical protein
MDATVKLTVHPRNEIPSDQRVQWIERYGVPPETQEVEVRAPLTLWQGVGAEILPDGTVKAIPYAAGPYWRKGASAEINEVLRSALLTTGAIPTALDATEILGALVETNRAIDRAKAEEALAEVREDAWRADEGIRGSGGYLWAALTDAERAEVDRLNVERAAATRAREVADRAEKDRALAEAAAAAEAAKVEIRAFALDGHAGPAAQRAAREEYDVTSAVIDAVQEQLAKPDAVSRPKDDYEWEERPAPRADAFELLDQITEAVAIADNKPACVELSVSRVMRITEPAEEGEEGTRRTGVVVTISSPVTEDRHLLYYAESAHE